MAICGFLIIFKVETLPDISGSAGEPTALTRRFFCSCSCLIAISRGSVPLRGIDIDKEHFNFRKYMANDVKC